MKTVKMPHRTEMPKQVDISGSSGRERVSETKTNVSFLWGSVVILQDSQLAWYSNRKRNVLMKTFRFPKI